MTRFPRTLLLALLLAVGSTAHAAGLPDTGQDTCYDNSAADGVAASDPASIARDLGTHPRQDCRYGRDAAAAAGQLTKIGAGAKGFDYTKIANNGTVLAAGAALGSAATDWACTKDNITGLTWEVKTDDNGLRDKDWTYTWHNTTVTENGGNAGSTGGATCGGTLASCNTQAFVAAVNTAALCGHSDGWRLPTQRELLTLVYADGSSPSIDPTYFLNTPASDFWSGSAYVPDPSGAWIVLFSNGATGAYFKTSSNYARLVRGGQF